MADKEATRKIGEAILVCRTPDVCKTPMGSSMVPVPYQIISKFETATKTATTVNFTGEPAFNMGSYLPTVIGDEAGVGGGLKTGSHKGKCYPLTHSSSVRVEGQWLVRHDDLFEMNCNSPGNTIGKVIYDKVVTKENLSTLLDAIPVLGTIKGAGQLITGKDLVTGEPVNRWVEAGGLILSLAPGGKAAVSGGKAIVKGVLKEGGEKLLKEGGEKLVKEGAEKLVKEGGEKLAKESGERLAKESVEKAEKEIAEKATQKAAQKTTEEAVEKTGKKATKKGSKDGSKVTKKGKKGPCDDLKKGNGPGQHRGGAYDKTRGSKKDNTESHHMPAKKASPLREEDGPAIQMDQSDHWETSSNGSGVANKSYLNTIKKLVDDKKWREAMAAEIRDVRRVAREAGDLRKYNEAIKEMLKYFHCLDKSGLLL